MTSYKVSYFPGKGNAEIIRLALVAAGLQDFEDERLNRDEWAKIKQDTPTKQMPILTVTENGTSNVYAQSGTCAKYIARRYGLFGKGLEQEVLVDEVFECVSDLQRDCGKFYFEKDEAKKEELKKKCKEESIPRVNEYITSRTKKYGKNGFIIGDKMTLADLHLYNIVDQVTGGFPDFFPADSELLKHANLVKSDEKIQGWIKRMPKPQF